jgi:hypothetical protein
MSANALCPEKIWQYQMVSVKSRVYVVYLFNSYTLFCITLLPLLSGGNVHIYSNASPIC